LMDPIVVPGVLSYLAYGNFSAKVTGLSDISPDQQPPIEIVYYAYHIMVGLGTIFIAILAIASFCLWRKSLSDRRAVLWLLMLATPFPYIANEAGWTVAEVGRQPWTVYEVQRVAVASSSNVTAGMTYFTLFGFMGLYLLTGLLYLVLFFRIVQQGPATDDNQIPPGALGTGAAVSHRRS
jgi:cytochrome bd ubiquinol oxidase subunit I